MRKYKKRKKEEQLKQIAKDLFKILNRNTKKELVETGVQNILSWVRLNEAHKKLRKNFLIFLFCISCLCLFEIIYSLLV